VTRVNVVYFNDKPSYTYAITWDSGVPTTCSFRMMMMKNIWCSTI